MTSSEPSNVAFEGKPDPALAATYKTSSGSVYVLSPNGKFRFDGKNNTPGGEKTTHGEGEWAVSGKRLIFRDANGVVPYDFVVKGKNLKLSLTGTMKNETVFVRQ